MADVDKLIGVLQRLTETGNSVLVIEHNLDVIKVADYLIDLGPEGGDKGGEIVCEGTPEEVAACEKVVHGAVPQEDAGETLISAAQCGCRQRESDSEANHHLRN